MADHKAPKGGLYVMGMKVANEGDPVSEDYLKALEDQGFDRSVMGNSEKTSGGVSRTVKDADK